MKKQAGFLTSFFGSCCGTAIFFRLMHHRWRRVIWHSLLISAIGGIAMGLAAYKALQSNAALFQAAFLSTFGNEVLVGKETIVPKRNPETPRSAVLPYGGQLLYTGTGQGMALEKKAAFYYVIWRPQDLTLLAMQEEQQEGFRVKFGSREIARLKNPDLAKLLQNSGFSREKELAADFSLLAESMLRTIRFSSMAGKGLWLLLMSWLYTGVFVLVYRIFHASRLHVLTIGSLWKCGIYAGFPPLAVAVVWNVLDLPLLNYETVYMAGLLIYWMVVIAQIESHPELEEKNADE